jgi:hypothetical protein
LSNIKLCVADNLVKTTANKNRNYWSLLSCLVEEQEEEDTNHLLSISLVMTRPNVKNKIAEKWKQKIANRTGILDSGCTLGAGAEKDMDCFHDTSLPSNKVFMLPDKTKIKATKMMQLKHKLQAGAGKINIVPNLHSTLISVPKMAGTLQCLIKLRLEFMMGLQQQSQHWKSPSSLHCGVRTRVFGKWSYIWTSKSWGKSTQNNSSRALMRLMQSLTYPTLASH